MRILAFRFHSSPSPSCWNSRKRQIKWNKNTQMLVQFIFCRNSPPQFLLCFGSFVGESRDFCNLLSWLSSQKLIVKFFKTLLKIMFFWAGMWGCFICCRRILLFLMCLWVQERHRKFDGIFILSPTPSTRDASIGMHEVYSTIFTIVIKYLFSKQFAISIATVCAAIKQLDPVQWPHTPQPVCFTKCAPHIHHFTGRTNARWNQRTDQDEKKTWRTKERIVISVGVFVREENEMKRNEKKKRHLFDCILHTFLLHFT